jgi:DNA-directed RNA polymerase I, II, and III subunit RPABC3
MVLTLYIISIFQAGRKTLADKFDYVMHGKLYKISEDSSSGQATKVYGFYEFQI